MTRKELIHAAALAIAAQYDRYEMMDNGADEGALYAEAVRLLETEPETIASYLEW